MNSSRIFLVALGLLIASMGGAFCYWLWTGYEKVRPTYDWPETPCLILNSEIVEDTRVPGSIPDYRLDIVYTYEFNGQRYTSEQVRTRVRRVKEVDKLEPFLESHPIGEKSVCYVNPADPSYAILQRDTKAALYTIWFPGLFVIGGLGMAIAALRKK